MNPFVTRPHRSRRAMTLLEVTICLGLGGILLTIVALLAVNGSRSIMAMTNYNELDRESRVALDRLTRDIRQGRDLLYYHTNIIAITSGSSNLLFYYYNPLSKTFNRYADGNFEVLLTECDRLEFNVSQRNPSNDFTFHPATTWAQAKLIDVNWTCSRQIKGQRVNTESIQTAKIVMRN
jgi:prepilin-type N-terminal cleavage/methylation domain-containing protein